MTACQKCQCPLILLRRDKKHTEVRKLCARCLEAPVEKPARSRTGLKPAYRALPDRPRDRQVQDMDSFMNDIKR